MFILIALIVLIGVVLVTILFMPFIISSRLTRMEERQAVGRTEELRAFIAELKMEEENEILSAGRHRERKYYNEHLGTEIPQPTSNELETLFGDPSELESLAKLVKDIQSQPSRDSNNYDHRD